MQQIHQATNGFDGAREPSVREAHREAHAPLPKEARRFELPGFQRISIEDIDLRSMWRTIWRWRRIVLLVTVCCCLVAYLIVQSLTPVYTAATQVTIGPRQAQAVNLVEVLSTLKGDPETISTELGVIRSRKLAQKTIVELGLDTNPDFIPTPGLTHRAIDYLRGQLSQTWPQLRPRTIEPLSAEARQAAVVDMFLDRLKVANDGKSRIVTIAFQSTDAQLAAQVVNKVTDFYIVSQLDAKFEATRRTNAWLSDRLATLHQEVLASEDAVEKFRRDNGLLRGPATTLATQEVSQVAVDLTAARAKRIEAQSRLSQLQKAAVARQQSRGERNSDWASIPEVLQSPLIQKLREQESDMQRRTAELLQQYGDKHPSVVKNKAESGELSAKIQNEIAKIIDGLRSEVANQQSRETNLNAMLEKLKGESSKNSIAEVTLRDLERTAQAARTLYENFLQRFKETQSQENFQQPDADVISPAAVPTVPSFPQKTVFLILSALVGIILGALIALIIENRDVGIRSMEQVKNLLKLTPLGLIPALHAKSRGRERPENEVMVRPTSAYSEAIRTVQTNLILSHVDARVRTVLVTSSLPSEGKSSTASSLAQIAARYGQRVVIVDCDLRRPTLHRLWASPAAPGLAEFLLHQKELNEVIHTEHPSGAHLIPAGTLPEMPPNLLSSSQFRSMLHNLKNYYDLVILDSAPVLSIADTKVLAALADRTVLIVHWATTPLRVVSSTIDSLMNAGANIAGVVLTRVNVKSHARDGFSDSVLYAGRLQKYYQ